MSYYNKCKDTNSKDTPIPENTLIPLIFAQQERIKVNGTQYKPFLAHLDVQKLIVREIRKYCFRIPSEIFNVSFSLKLTISSSHV